MDLLLPGGGLGVGAGSGGSGRAISPTRDFQKWDTFQNLHWKLPEPGVFEV